MVATWTSSCRPAQDVRARFKPLPLPWDVQLNGTAPLPVQTTGEDDKAYFEFPVDVIGWVAVTEEVTAVVYAIQGGDHPIAALRTFKGDERVDDRRIGQASGPEKPCGWTTEERLRIDSAGRFDCTTLEVFRPCTDTPMTGDYKVIRRTTAGEIASNGNILASYQVKVEFQEPYKSIIRASYGKDILFHPHGAALDAKDKEELEAWWASLPQQMRYNLVNTYRDPSFSPQVILSGWADDKGSAQANLDLARRRTGSVYGWLVMEKGVPDSKIHFVIQGEHEKKPVAHHEMKIAPPRSPARMVTLFIQTPEDE